jgi:hypothetical protein
LLIGAAHFIRFLGSKKFYDAITSAYKTTTCAGTKRYHYIHATANHIIFQLKEYLEVDSVFTPVIQSKLTKRNKMKQNLKLETAFNIIKRFFVSNITFERTI